MTTLPPPASPSEETSPVGTNPIGVLVFALLRSWFWIVMATVLGAGAGLILGLMQSNTFTSTGKLLLRAGERESLSPERIAGDFSRGHQDPRGAAANQLHLLRSRALFERTARKIGPEVVLAPYDPTKWSSPDDSFLRRWMHSFQRWWFASRVEDAGPADPETSVQIATDILMQSIRVEGDFTSTVYVAWCSSSTGTAARDILDAYLTSAEEYHRLFFSVAGVVEAMQQKIKEANTHVEALLVQMRAFKTEHKFSNFDVELADAQSAVGRLEQDVAEMEQEVAAQNALLTFLNQQLQGDRIPRTIRRARDAGRVPNSLYNSLELRVVEIEANLLSGRLLSAEKETLRKELEVIGERLKTIPQFFPPDETEVELPNPEYEELRRRYQATQEEVTSIEQKLATARTQLTEWRATLKRLDDAYPKYKAIENELLAATTESSRLLAELGRMTDLSRLDEMGFSNLRVLEAATLPLYKSGPSRLRSIAIGAVLCGMASVAFALVRHLLDGRIRRTADVPGGLGIPLLTVIDESRIWRGLTPNRPAADLEVP
jgi:uncharacterized protein involved in exopolysaccharide biosynthesis